jgi:hypothetical protein
MDASIAKSAKIARGAIDGMPEKGPAALRAEVGLPDKETSMGRVKRMRNRRLFANVASSRGRKVKSDLPFIPFRRRPVNDDQGGAVPRVPDRIPLIFR